MPERSSEPRLPARFAFGVFELDQRTGELRKAGVRVRLSGQPLQLLERFLDRPGELITRDELRQELWTDDTFVDFERNLNSAIQRLRAALGDTAESPRFIETLPRRGYRFLVPVDQVVLSGPAAAAVPALVPALAPILPSRIRRRWPLIAVGLGLAAAAVLLTISRDRPAQYRAIAVLPFALADPSSPGDEYIAFGMSEALVTELSRRGGIRVISQSSSSRYRDAGRALPEIARELGVDVVVEGSVQREGSRIRITVQLIEAATDTHLWAEHYERDIGGIFTLVDDVARAVAGKVHVRVAGAEAARQRAPTTVDAGVADAYLKGRYHLGRGTEVDSQRAVEYFEQALALDPAHAASHTGLADYYTLTDALAPEEAAGKARLHARRALALDGALPDAHASLAFLHFYYDWNWREAERAFERALELDPGHARAQRWYALFLSAMGRHGDASRHIESALSLDPTAIVTHDAAATVRFQAREFAATVATGRSIHELNPFDPRGHEHMAIGLLFERRYPEAHAEIEKGLALASSSPALQLMRVASLLGLGRALEAGTAVQAMASNAPGARVPGVVLSVAHAELGDHARALDGLEQAYDARDPYLVLINVNPWFDALRDKPRFRRLRDRLAFPE